MSAGAPPGALLRDPSAGPLFTPYVDRDMSIAPGGLSSMLSFSVVRPENRYARPSFGMNMGLGTGIIGRLWAEGYLGTLELAPEVRWEDPKVGLLYQILNTYPFEIDPAVYVTFDTGGGPAVKRIDPSLILVFRAAHAVRFDTGAYVPVSFEDRTALGLSIPARLAVQLTPHVHVGVTSGASFADLRAPRRSATVPLGFLAGYSALLGEGVTLTVGPGFSWPMFVSTGERERFYFHTRGFVAELGASLSVSP